MSNNTIEEQDQLIAQARALAEAPKIDKREAERILSKINVSEVIKGATPQIEEAQLASMANERAAREPLPGAYGDVFDTQPIQVHTSVGDVTIRPMVAYDINIFKLINSPFYQIMMGDKVQRSVDNQLFATEEESYEMIFQFTHSPKVCYELFKKGKDAYRDKVMEEVSFVYNPAEAAMLVEKIMEHIFKVNMAKVSFEAPETPDVDVGGKKNLIPPAPTNTTS